MLAFFPLSKIAQTSIDVTSKATHFSPHFLCTIAFAQTCTAFTQPQKNMYSTQYTPASHRLNMHFKPSSLEHQLLQSASHHTQHSTTQNAYQVRCTLQEPRVALLENRHMHFGVSTIECPPRPHPLAPLPPALIRIAASSRLAVQKCQRHTHTHTMNRLLCADFVAHISVLYVDNTKVFVVARIRLVNLRLISAKWGCGRKCCVSSLLVLLTHSPACAMHIYFGADNVCVRLSWPLSRPAAAIYIQNVVALVHYCLVYLPQNALISEIN